jgi:hypothetical protein
MRTVEIFSATDPVQVADRQVWYWAEFEGKQTERFPQWAPVNDYAQKLCARYPDVAIIDRSDKDSGYLRSTLDLEGRMNTEDKYFQHPNGTIIVRPGDAPYPWLVTWLPDDQTSGDYPGFTMSSTDGEVPTGPTIEAVVKWAVAQPWANRQPTPAAAPSPSPPPPENAAPLNVPADEWADLQHRAFEHHVKLGFTREPDGSFSFGVYSLEGELLQHGVADTWDDARLGMIENLYPPSGEK